MSHNVRVTRAIGTASVLATLARLGTARDQFLALTAGSPDALPLLLVDAILSSRLRRSFENDLLSCRVPVGDDGGVRLALLDESRALLAAFLPLGLGPLGRNAWASLAARVLALGAFLSESERGVAQMAFPVHAHLDRLLDTQGVSFSRVPFAGLQLQTIQLAELLRPLSKELRPRNPDGIGIIGLLGRQRLGRRATFSMLATLLLLPLELM